MFTVTCDVPLDDETCLFVLLDVEDGVTYNAARRSCSGREGKVAVIPDDKAYDLVMAYVRSILPEEDVDSVELWTGLKVDPLVRIIFTLSHSVLACTPLVTTRQCNYSYVYIIFHNCKSSRWLRFSGCWVYISLKRPMQ